MAKSFVMSPFTGLQNVAADTNFNIKTNILCACACVWGGVGDKDGAKKRGALTPPRRLITAEIFGTERGENGADGRRAASAAGQTEEGVGKSLKMSHPLSA